MAYEHTLVYEEGILCAISKKKESPQTLEDVKKSIDDFKKITQGEKVCMLLDITNSTPTPKEIRDYIALEMPKIAKAIAMLSNSPLGKMVANLFFGLKPPPSQLKFFPMKKRRKSGLNNIYK